MIVDWRSHKNNCYNKHTYVACNAHYIQTVRQINHQPNLPVFTIVQTDRAQVGLNVWDLWVAWDKFIWLVEGYKEIRDIWEQQDVWDFETFEPAVKTTLVREAFMKYKIINLTEYNCVCDGGGSREQAEGGDDEGHCSWAGGAVFSLFSKSWISLFWNVSFFQVVKSVEGPLAEAGNKKSVDLQKFLERRIVDVKTLGKELFLIFDQEICLRSGPASKMVLLSKLLSGIMSLSAQLISTGSIFSCLALSVTTWRVQTQMSRSMLVQRSTTPILMTEGCLRVFSWNWGNVFFMLNHPFIHSKGVAKTWWAFTNALLKYGPQSPVFRGKLLFWTLNRKPFPLTLIRWEAMISLDICWAQFDATRAFLKIVEAKNQERIVADVLMDQEVLPGVGNIIKNEACFNAGVNPLSMVKEVPEGVIRRLVRFSN